MTTPVDLAPGFRMTEIGPFPEEWEVVPFEHATTITRGVSWRKGDESPSGTPIIGIPNVGTDGRVRLDIRYRVNKRIARERLLSPGDILLVGSSGSVHNVGRAAVVPDHPFSALGFASFLAKADPREGVCDRSFLLHLVRSPLVDFAVCARRAADGKYNLQVQQLRQQLVPLPPLPEQRSIAAVLDTVRRVTEATEKVIGATRELKRSLTQYLFTYGPVPHDQADQVPLKETEIGPMPEGWDVVSLGDVARIRYGLGQPPELDEGGVPMIRATNIKRGRIVREGLIRLKKEAIPASRDPFLRTGDIIVVRSGAYTGDVAAVTPEWEGAVAGYDLVVSPEECLHPSFCSQFLLGTSAQRYFRGQRDRSAQPHLNAQQLSGTEVPLPPPDEQREIADTLSATDATAASNGARRSALGVVFTALLHRLMTGQVRVNDLDLPSEEKT